MHAEPLGLRGAQVGNLWSRGKDDMSIAFVGNTNVSHKKVVWDLVKLWLMLIYLENVASKFVALLFLQIPNILNSHPQFRRMY